MKDRAAVAVTITRTMIRRILRTTQPVPTIFPMMIIVSRATERPLIITVLPPICGERIFVTIRGTTIIGTRVRIGMDITRTGAGASVTDSITAADTAALMDGAEAISLPAEQEPLAARGVEMVSYEAEM